MEYTLDEPLWFNEQGKRNYNEDFVIPHKQATENDHVFMVCDGVGGSAKGDVAARVTGETFSSIMSNRIKQFTAGDYHQATQKTALNNVLRKVEKKLDAAVLEHPGFEGMATTLTYLHLSKFGAVVAWAGDSRIYQFRDGQIVKQTTDHSLVNELIKLGEITPEEAKNHPRRNVITRAVSGTENPTKLDVEIWEDVQSHDIFMLCTDGVLEAIDEKDIAQCLAREPLEYSYKIIKNTCATKSNDNYSMVMVRLAEVKGQVPWKPIASARPEKTKPGITLGLIPADAPTKIPASSIKDEEDHSNEKSIKHKKGTTAIGLIVGLVVLSLIALRYFVDKQPNAEEVNRPSISLEDKDRPSRYRPEKEGPETCSDLDEDGSHWSELELKWCFGPYVLATIKDEADDQYRIYNHSDGTEIFGGSVFTEYTMIGDSVLIARKTELNPTPGKKGRFGILSASSTGSPEIPEVEFSYDTIYRVSCIAPADSLLVLIRSTSQGSDTTYKKYNLEEATVEGCP
ncbi:PP2C family protein-serine/threonine phosphatase [Phaeodactylibacter xiamenensis]|jgi:protein phosphatase|uniref:PP2C family protein-serine/threonine phosphatase n=1 Tax=Phaeodactylibacter xiamenensis TaxID=1524460 RepID=UPI0024A82C3B|nr:protein phosphatase 2C domain-containing protein [Phaeodactylibacter xiamenensis]